MVHPVTFLLVLAAAALATVERLTEDVRRSVVESAATRIVDGYVYPDSGRLFAARLREKLESGSYAAIENRVEFARALSRDLLAISHDKHLRVFPAPPPGGEARVDTLADGTVRRRLGAPPMQNGGFERIAILDGGVGYVRLRGFSASDEARARCDSMMKAFDGVNAVIVDLRRNRGGDGRMVEHLSGWFFDRSVHLHDRWTREAREPIASWSDPGVANAKHAKTPVYVLTSDSTFSAGEAFAHAMKTQKRATLIGEPTGGGGHFGRVEPLVAGFALWLPHGRTVDPKTGKGFQGTGVIPDVRVPEATALDKALELARKGS